MDRILAMQHFRRNLALRDGSLFLDVYEVLRSIREYSDDLTFGNGAVTLSGKHGFVPWTDTDRTRRLCRPQCGNFRG